MSANIHERLRAAVTAGKPAPVVDAILAECPEGECYQCGEIVCPYSEPLHYHHDGCPACAEHDPP